MDPTGNLRQLQEHEQPRPDEIVVPAAKLPDVQRMSRPERRAWYRAEAKRLATEARRG
jgi:hypothetical protein